MPIKGMTRREDLQPRFPRIGKLRKGGERDEGARKPGPELDHFRFTSDDADVVRAFHAAYGDHPRLVNVYLPYATLEECFQTWKEEWTAGGLKHRCDGERTVIFLADPAKGKYETDPAKQIACPGGCDEVGRLEVIIPELFEAGYVGTVTMETHSINDLITIAAALAKTEEIRNGHKLGLRGIMFNLRRVQEKISAPGFGQNAGKRQRVKKWLVRLDPAPEWVALQMHVGENVLDVGQEVKQLDVPEGTTVYNPVDGDVVEIPEGVDVTPAQTAAFVRSAHNIRFVDAMTPEEREARAEERRRQRERDDHAFDDVPFQPDVDAIGGEPPEYDPAADMFVDTEPGEPTIGQPEWEQLVKDARRLYGAKADLMPFRSWLKEQFKIEHAYDLTMKQYNEALNLLDVAIKDKAAEPQQKAA